MRRVAVVVCLASGFVLLAYPALGPAKLRRLMALPESVSLTVGLDSREALEELGRHSHPLGRRGPVRSARSCASGRHGRDGYPPVP